MSLKIIVKDNKKEFCTAIAPDIIEEQNFSHSLYNKKKVIRTGNLAYILSSEQY